MMKNIVFLFFVFCGVFSFAQKATLSGTLSGCEKDTKLLILDVDGSKLKVGDTVAVDAKGHYAVSREVKDVDFFLLVPLRPGQVPDDKLVKQSVHVMLHPGDKVKMDVAYLPTVQNVKVVRVEGSADMELYRQFNNNLIDAAIVQSLQSTLADRTEKLLSENRTCLMSAFLVTFFDEDFISHAGLYRQIRDALKPRYAGNGFVRYIDGKLNGVLVAGMAAPDVQMKDRNGNVRKLSDLRGKVVLLDFWASWCRPCRMENPNVVRLYHKYHADGFEVFSVSLDNNRDAWLKAIQDDGLVWENHVSDLKGWTSSGGKLYGVASIPATVLIAPDGTIIARNLRGPDLEAKLKEIFGK